MGSVRFSGPLFEGDPRVWEAGRRKGLSRIGTQVEATILLKTPRRTGQFARTIRSGVWRNANGVTIASGETRPIRTWLERRTRRGIRLGTGARMFAAGKRKAKTLDMQGIIGEEIARVLNG